MVPTISGDQDKSLYISAKRKTNAPLVWSSDTSISLLTSIITEVMMDDLFRC